MAKIASSKPYGSGKKNTPTKQPLKDIKVEAAASPVRTSPRRRKSINSEEPAVTEVKSIKPAAPKFNDSSKKRKESKRKSLPKNPRRKSGLEPVILEEANSTEENVDNMEGANNPADNVDNTEDIADNYTSEIEEDEKGIEEDYIADYIDSIEKESGSTSVYEPSSSETKIDENSSIFESDYTDNDAEYAASGAEYAEDEVEETISDEEVAFHFDDQESVEDSEVLSSDYNSQFLNEGERYTTDFRYTSTTVRSRLAEYFKNQSSSSSSNSTSKIWNRMKEGAKELGLLTFEYTKRAIEQISKKSEKSEVDSENESRIYEITDQEEEEGNDFEMEDYQNENNLFEEDYNDSKKIKLMEQDNMEADQFPESRQTSYHSVPEYDETMILESGQGYDNYGEELSTPQASKSSSKIEADYQASKSAAKMEHSEILDSRLTEIVLFLAKVSKSTPISTIYEHLEEFFTLKGSFALNYIEKQLVSSVLKEYLTEGDDENDVMSGAGFGVPAYDPIVVSSSLNVSPSRVKVLPSSGIRFRAPKFTLEEEVRLEEMEKARLQSLSVNKNKVSSLSTPSQRSKLSKKLLTPRTFGTMIEEFSETRGRAALHKKEDSVGAAIENIISQKVKEAKDREEAERLETEKLKARVIELEREARDRQTKEALLQKQLEEQKKELEIEKEAAKVKIEKLKAAAVSSSTVKPTTSDRFGSNSGSAGAGSGGAFSFGAVKPGVTSDTCADKSLTTSGTLFNGNPGTASVTPFGKSSFNFGSSKPPADKSTEVPSFSFGASKRDGDVDSSATANPFKSFSFGSAKKEVVEEEIKIANEAPLNVSKPASPFGFTFAKYKVEEKSKEEDGIKALKSAEVDGTKALKSQEDVSKASGASTTTQSTFGSTFNFGTSSSSTPATTAAAASTFNLGNTNPTKPAFNFGTSEIKKEESGKVGVGFNVNEPVKSFNFGGTSGPSGPSGPSSQSGKQGSSAFSFAVPTPTTSTSTNPSAFNFGSSTSSSKSDNPFAGLNSGTSIFNNNNNPTFSFGNQPMNSGSSTAPLSNFNFGGGGTQPATNPSTSSSGDQPAEMTFQAGNRSISIPKRRRK